MANTKKALLHSLLILALCLSAFAGSTYAWFTDSVSSSNNIIKSGRLDIKMYWTDDLDGNSWVDVDTEGAPPVFNNDKWEPGYTEVRYIKIVNNGNLAFKYKLDIIPNGEVGKLADVIDVYYVKERIPDLERTTVLDRMQPAGPLSGIIDGSVSAEGQLLPAGASAPAGIDAGDTVLTVALKMDESADNTYQNGSIGDTFDIRLTATQMEAEFDNFDSSYDSGAQFPSNELPISISKDITSLVENGQLTEAVTFTADNGVSVTVPAGVAVDSDKLTLEIREKKKSDSNVYLEENEKLKSFDVHVKGVAETNSVPMAIDMGEVLPTGLNKGNLSLYHVEKGNTAKMSEVADVSGFNAHNQFVYEPANGNLIVNMATFSEVAVVADTTAAWEGKIADGFSSGTGTESDPYIIANADQLVYLGDRVSDDNANYGSKHYKLVADVNMGGEECVDKNGKLQFYPIGYTAEGYKSAFSGTFDGQGHTISYIYQNTWMLLGTYDGTYYNAAMGLFGYVNGGTVKNLTIDNFHSEGEFAPTGCVAAYAAGNATFENIAITNSHPQTYNTGVAGIVGWDNGGDTEDEASNLTFKNITIDSTNTISALWGSWDVAAAGLLGYLGEYSKANLNNCHVSATIDVYNDVCGNYQYYWYRYCGMMIGTVDKRLDNGKGALDLSNITATNCTVDFGDRHEYYYCEFVENTKASYTHDYQFSRVDNKDIVGSGDSATCVNHNHEEHEYETVNGVSVLVEDKQAVYIPFRQVFGGYGWGVDGKDLDDLLGIKDVTEKTEPNDQVKFETKFTGDFLYRVGNANNSPVSLGILFKEIKDNTVNDSGVYVTIDKVNENSNVSGTFKADTDDWTKGTIQFSGTGVVKVTIQDYDYCKPTELYLEVVDATNITSATAGTGKNFVLLQDVKYEETYLYYKNSTVYGNGFTLDITGADHSDLKDTSDTNSNKSAYCNIWMVDSTFNNVNVVGSVYPKVGMTADSDYGNAAIRTEGDCYIVNSIVSNCRVPLRVQGNTTIIDSIIDGGRYANIELRSGKLTLNGVTTINTARKGSDGTTDVIGFGIVIHDEAANASISVVGDGLKQYNWAGENKHKSILSEDTYLSNAYKLIFNANNSDTIYFDYNNDRYVNTGILCLCADINKDAVTGLDDRYCQEVSGYDAWVLTYDNSKHTDWFNESVSEETVAYAPEQYPIIPNYSGNAAQTVEFTRGETYYFDTSVLKAEKFGQNLTISSVVINETTYNYGDKIPLTEGGVYEVVYTVVDPYNYNADASSTTTVNHTVSITVTAIAKDAEILAPNFTFIDQNGNKYEAVTVKVGDKTYVMPNVTDADPTTNSMSSINIGSASISGTTVYFPVATGYTVRSGSNFNRYYPLFNGINITDYTIAGDTTGTTYTTSGNYTSLVGSSGTKFIIPANGGQTNCGDYVKTDGQAGNAAGNSDSGWQGAGYSTSYGGTYLKSGNTNASSGADKNGYERIVWVEYSFNAGNGDVYYYRIGYHCNKESTQSCVTPDTLITLADGSQVRVDSLTGNEQLLVWNHTTGALDVAPIAYIVNHDGEVREQEVIHLYFEDGTDVKIIGEHVFFDTTLNKYVTLDMNADEFIGHEFLTSPKADGTMNTAALVKVEKALVETAAYEVVTDKQLTCFTDNVLSASAYMDKLLNIFDVDSRTMGYTLEDVQKDIETYGLYTYEDFAGLISEEAFELYNAKYLKIAVGKGYIDWNDILELIDVYFNVEVTPLV